MRVLLVSAALSIVAPVAALLSQTADAQHGLAKGAVAPPIEMLDQFGRRQTLQSLAGEKGLVLLFVRSADW
jgi:hypothetical protein